MDTQEPAAPETPEHVLPRLFYSPSAKGFYDEAIHTTIPADAVEITREQHAALMEAQAGGATIKPGAGGAPVAASATVADLRAAQIATLSVACQAAIVSGFASDALGAVHSYPSKLVDQQNLAANVLSSLLPGLPGDWTTMQMCANGQGQWAYRPHTAAQIQKVGADGKAAILAHLMTNAALAAQVATKTTANTIAAVVWPD